MEAIIEKAKKLNYPAYKHSGEDWIGDVPKHWGVVKLKHLFHEKRKTTNVDLPCGSISFGKVVFKDDEKIPVSTKKSYQVLSKGEFLLNPLNLNYDLISLRIALSDIDVVVSSGYIIMQSSMELDKSYYKWLLNRFDVEVMKTLGSGVRQTINFSDIGDSLLVFPPIDEQILIAKFLDSKTSLIDQAINIKETQIELLKERRQILIHKAVTRGLNPDVKLKDSGVDWIGEIPMHWELKRLKYIIEQIQTGTTPSTASPDFFDGIVDWYTPKDLNNEMLVDSERKLSNLAVERKEVKIFPKDSVLIVGIGGTSGKTSYLLKEGSFNQQITGFHSWSSSNKFYFYLLKSISSIMLNMANYATLPILNNEFFKSLLLIKPPLEEQKSISQHADEISRRTKVAINLHEMGIQKLKEYKATLIHSAVTGKIKVS